MSKRKRIVPNVIRGGVAIPLGANYFLMNGNTHEQGGIDIGKDLEVENGEIIKTNPKSIKVLSNAPIINGITPAQLALGGLKDGTFENRFNKGFKYQERFKDINGLKDDGTKAKIGKETKITQDKQLVEDVVRTSGGITGAVLTKEFPFIDFNQLSRGIRTWRVMKGNKNKVASDDENYTGVAMEGKGLTTDNGLGFVSTKDLVDTFGKKPVDFVDTYLTGETPFKEQGVIKKTNTPEKHIYRTKLSKIKDKEVPVFQTHKDTLRTSDVKYLDNELAHGRVDLRGENTTYPGSPVEIGNSGIIYDGNNATIASLTLPDGTIAYKALDVFDTDPEEWNYFVGPYAKKGLKFIHDNTNPFLMTTPWYFKKDDRTEEEKLKQIFGIEYDADGNFVNYGDHNGKKWTIGEALEWIDSHEYESVIDTNKKLGGKVEMSKNKRNVPSTGKKIKAKWGVKIDNPKTLEAKNYGLNVVEPGLAPISGYHKKADGSFTPINQTTTSPNVSFLEANPNFLGNNITAGANVIGSTISYFANRKMLKDLKEPIRPEALQAVKLKTNINIKPQLNQLRRTIDKYNRFVDRNTASSQVAAGRLLNNELYYIDGYNQLYGSKENQETQLINQDRLNSQEVAKYNLENYNNWRDNVRTFKNTIREKQSENTNDYIQNLAGTFGNFLNNNAQ